MSCVLVPLGPQSCLTGVIELVERVSYFNISPDNGRFSFAVEIVVAVAVSKAYV